jgi:hypothetical protein
MPSLHKSEGLSAEAVKLTTDEVEDIDAYLARLNK